MNSEGEEFGEDRLWELIRAGGNCTPAELVDQIQNAIKTFRGESEVNDDFTLLIGQIH